MSVFGLLYQYQLEGIFQQNEATNVGTWTFLIYLTTWNFFSECVSLFFGVFSSMLNFFFIYHRPLRGSYDRPDLPPRHSYPGIGPHVFRGHSLGLRKAYLRPVPLCRPNRRCVETFENCRQSRIFFFKIFFLKIQLGISVFGKLSFVEKRN